MDDERMTAGREEADVQRAGLCASCRYAEIVTSSRGSRFYQCRLSDSNPQFPRYPILPVMFCTGHRRAV